MTNTKIPLAIQSITLKNMGPFGDKGLTINFGEKKNPDKANIHILVGKNGSGKSTVLQSILSCLVEDRLSVLRSKTKWNSLISLVPKTNDYSTTLKTVSGPLKITVLNDLEYPVFQYEGNNIVAQTTHFQNKINLAELNKLHIDSSKKDFNAFVQWIGGRHAKIDIYKGNNNTGSIKQTEDFIKLLKETIGNFIEKDIEFDWQYEPELFYIKVNKENLNIAGESDGLKFIWSFFGDIFMKLENYYRKFEYANTPVNLIPFILLLDEIEIHLHPAWQRKILPAIQKLFPNAEIFCTTHSPFVVNSVDNAWVYEISEENYKGGVLNGVETNTFNSFGSVLIENFNVEDEFGTNNNGEIMESAKIDLRKLSDFIKHKNIPEILKIVIKVRKSNNISLKSRVEFELSKNNIEV
jgi:predicted ATP-binding protein involved in virulence